MKDKKILNNISLKFSFCWILLIPLLTDLTSQDQYAVKYVRSSSHLFPIDNKGKITFKPYRFNNSKFSLKYRPLKVPTAIAKCKLFYYYDIPKPINLVSRQDRHDKYGYVQLDDNILRMIPNKNTFNTILTGETDEQCNYLKNADNVKFKDIGNFLKDFEFKFIHKKGNVHFMLFPSEFLFNMVPYNIEKFEFNELYKLTHSDFGFLEFTEDYKKRVKEDLDLSEYLKHLENFEMTTEENFSKFKKKYSEFCRVKQDNAYQECKPLL
jgi:hypothetical protein